MQSSKSQIVLVAYTKTKQIKLAAALTSNIYLFSKGNSFQVCCPAFHLVFMSIFKELT